MPLTADAALRMWEEGDARVQRADAEARRALDRVVERVVAELQRRLGGPFTLGELAGLYDSGTDWVLELAMKAAPGDPRAWDAQALAGAAFWRYAHRAKDFAGGRRAET